MEWSLLVRGRGRVGCWFGSGSARHAYRQLQMHFSALTNFASDVCEAADLFHSCANRVG